jgi:hypothetical protein
MRDKCRHLENELLASVYIDIYYYVQCTVCIVLSLCFYDVIFDPCAKLY